MPVAATASALLAGAYRYIPALLRGYYCCTRKNTPPRWYVEDFVEARLRQQPSFLGVIGRLCVFGHLLRGTWYASAGLTPCGDVLRRCGCRCTRRLGFLGGSIPT